MKTTGKYDHAATCKEAAYEGEERALAFVAGDSDISDAGFAMDAWLKSYDDSVLGQMSDSEWLDVCDYFNTAWSSALDAEQAKDQVA